MGPELRLPVFAFATQESLPQSDRRPAGRDLMIVQGVADTQIKTVSYGEEKPAVEGHDEAAWSKNRRVEIVYPGQ